MTIKGVHHSARGDLPTLLADHLVPVPQEYISQYVRSSFRHFSATWACSSTTRHFALPLRDTVRSGAASNVLCISETGKTSWDLPDQVRQGGGFDPGLSGDGPSISGPHSIGDPGHAQQPTAAVSGGRSRGEAASFYAASVNPFNIGEFRTSRWL